MVRIEAVVPGLAGWSDGAVSRDPHDEIQEQATQAARVLRELVPCAAYALCAWNPMSESHLHYELAREGYSQRVMDHLNDGYVRDNPAFELLHTRVPQALRWRDLARDWGMDFSRTLTAEEFLIPEGFREGTTACLRLRDGRYTGSLHMSWSKPSAATDDCREMIERFRPLLAVVCDALRVPKFLADSLAPGVGALVVSSEGMVAELPGHPTGPELADGSELRTLVARPGASGRHRRFLWASETGSCHRIDVIPCQGNVSLVTEQPISWPYGLTLRELEIVDLVAAGLSNPQIAPRLFVSRRTVSTHVEHVLAKTGCSSRAELAALAATEGLRLPRF